MRKKLILVRTNFNNNIGLGHIYRTKKLSLEFESKNYQIIFLLDKFNYLDKKVIKYKKIYLYPNNKKFKNQADDAMITSKICLKLKPSLIIVDDYRFNSIWQKIIKINKLKTLSFRDHNIKHVSDFVVNMKWEGNNNISKKNHLNGPNFSVIDRGLRKKNKINKIKNFLIYAGGSGNLTKILPILNSLKNILNKNKITNLKFNIIIGPLSKFNFSYIEKYKSKYFNFVKDKYDINNLLNKTDLYFGVSSSIIYDLNYLNIPALLYSTSSNQKNKENFLEDQGYYLNLENLNEPYKIAKLLLLMHSNYSRLKKMVNQKKIKVDKFGAKRIVNYVLNHVKKPDAKFNKNKIQIKNGLNKVPDKMINFYLKCRNQKTNRVVSGNSKQIKKIDHYIWWFSRKINKYFYYKNNKIKIFLSDEKIIYNKKKYYIGGLFKAEFKPTIIEVYQALTKHLKEKNLTWLAIINKKNKVFFNLNKLMGFLPIKSKNKINFLASKYNLKLLSKFHFLER